MHETRAGYLGQEDPLEKGWQPSPVFLPEKSPGQRSLAGYSLWGLKRPTLHLDLYLENLLLSHV